MTDESQNMHPLIGSFFNKKMIGLRTKKVESENKCTITLRAQTLELLVFGILCFMDSHMLSRYILQYIVGSRCLTFVLHGCSNVAFGYAIYIILLSLICTHKYLHTSRQIV